jgi:CheY-like chemotaxis protein/HPt (histidine-containing phosphotransfer) domain-containing protein
MDGLETAARIRKAESDRRERGAVKDWPADSNEPTISPESETFIILMFTAYGLEQAQGRSNTALAETHLLKPVKPSQLFNTIMDKFRRTEVALPHVKAQPAEPAPTLAQCRLLVAEDNALNRDVVVALLKEAGPVVETAKDGRQAVEIATGAPPGYFDAILMDIQMPVMDGYEATQRIRAWELESGRFDDPAAIAPLPSAPAKRIPIIALTAHALKGERERCLAFGMDDYIAKPIEEQQLQRMLLKWISHPKKREKTVEILNGNEPSRNPAVLDVSGALKRLGGREHIYRKVVRKFMPEFAETPEVIPNYLAAGDTDSAQRAAHSLKGASASIGAMALSRAAAAVEKAIDGKETDLQMALALVKVELDHVQIEISAYLDNAPPVQSAAASTVK